MYRTGTRTGVARLDGVNGTARYQLITAVMAQDPVPGAGQAGHHVVPRLLGLRVAVQEDDQLALPRPFVSYVEDQVSVPELVHGWRLGLRLRRRRASLWPGGRAV